MSVLNNVITDKCGARYSSSSLLALSKDIQTFAMTLKLLPLIAAISAEFMYSVLNVVPLVNESAIELRNFFFSFVAHV